MDKLAVDTLIQENRETVSQLWTKSNPADRQVMLVSSGFTPEEASFLSTKFWGELSDQDQEEIIIEMAG